VEDNLEKFNNYSMNINKRKNESLIHTLPKSETPYFIYGLIDPDNKEIKYVGLSTTGNGRFFTHWKSVSRNNKTAVKWWLKELKQDRKKIFDVVFLEYFDKDSELIDEAEIFWIAYFKGLGANLLNHELGGRATRGKFDIIETKRIHRERVKEGLNRPEVKAHLSELTKKQWADPEMRERMSKKVNINKEAQKRSKETCRKVRGSKFFDDLGNFYESVGDFADKWNTTINKVQYALYNERPILGRILKRAV
jgi:hypothetical protein